MEAIGAHAEGLAQAADTPMPVSHIGLDLAGTRADIDEDRETHELALVLYDRRTDRVAELVTDADGYDEAIEALDQIAEVAGRLAGLLRIRRGDRAVLSALADAAPDLPPDRRIVSTLPPANAASA